MTHQQGGGSDEPLEPPLDPPLSISVGYVDSILCTYIQVPAELVYFEGTLYSEASAVSLLPCARCSL